MTGYATLVIACRQNLHVACDLQLLLCSLWILALALRLIHLYGLAPHF